ncbi:MAG: DUF262 domain-containing protein [Actinobacteria bacterium]|nr:DUF262 domain-containing protein [Actinomycetota bacterium]
MKLDVSEKTLASLLSTPEEQFVVPLYQRPYSWTTEEVDQLWEDLTTHLSSEHFMGSIVLNEETKLGPQVIDGQQRLTTFMVLLGLIRDEYERLGSKYTGRPQQLLTADAYTPGDGRFKMRLGEVNRHVFREFVLLPRGEQERKEWAEKSSLPKDVQVKNDFLFANAQRLQKLLHDDYLGETQGGEREERLLALETKLSQRLLFVVIRVGSVDDAFLLFETLNDRGLQLGAADLIKSHLLSRIESENGKEKVSEAAQEWTELVDLLRGADIGRFLRYFLLMYYPKVQMDRVFKLFKEKLAKSTAESMLTHLKTMARYYGEFEQPSLIGEPAVRDVLEDVNDLRVPMTYVVLLPARYALRDQPEDFVRIGRLAEALAYRWTTITSKNAQQLESMFQEAGSTFVDKGAAGFDEALKKLVDSMPSSAEFLGYFRTKRMGTQYVARYTLRRIEEALSPGLEWNLKSPSKVHIEHIMPQNLSQPWLEALGDNAVEKHGEAVSRWGNLTLLAEKLNREARDSSFDAKKKIYSGDPGSAIRMTSLLQTEDHWGPSEIDARQQWLAQVADQLWSVEGAADSKSVQTPPYPFVDLEDAVNQLRSLIANHETSAVEFKSTARTNLHTDKKDPEIEKAIGKTLTAFANSKEGGTLLIGVSDDGAILGIESDYKYVKNGDRDGFALWVTDFVKERIDQLIPGRLKVTFVEVDGKTVCRVDVPPSPEPMFLSDNALNRFFVRQGNATNELSGNELFKYRNERWPDL